MTDLDFPNAPAAGDTFDRWTFDGTKWVLSDGGSDSPVGFTFVQDDTPVATSDGQTWFAPTSRISRVADGDRWVVFAQSAPHMEITHPSFALSFAAAGAALPISIPTVRVDQSFGEFSLADVQTFRGVGITRQGIYLVTLFATVSMTSGTLVPPWESGPQILSAVTARRVPTGTAQIMQTSTPVSQRATVHRTSMVFSIGANDLPGVIWLSTMNTTGQARNGAALDGAPSTASPRLSVTRLTLLD